MKSSITIILILGCFASSSFAQGNVQQKLDDGKKFFWQARFEQAVTTLTQVTTMENATREQLFEAYLHLGFALTRRNAPSSEVDPVFEQAVRSDPQKELNEAFFPPDLTRRFHDIRNKLVGCVLVVCDHPDVDIIAVKKDSILFTQTTPALLCDLPEQSYDIVITEQGYQEEFRPISFAAGVTDTLYIELTPNALQIQADSGGGGWKWLAGGGILAGAAAILYTTVIDKGGEESSGTQTLPAPPVRPPVP